MFRELYNHQFNIKNALIIRHVLKPQQKGTNAYVYLILTDLQCVDSLVYDGGTAEGS